MGLAEVVQHLVGEYIQYEKHSIFYALASTAVGVLGGVASGIAATAYGANALYTSLAAVGGYIVSRVAVALPLHLKNIYNLITGSYQKEAKKAPGLASAGNLAPAPAT